MNLQKTVKTYPPLTNTLTLYRDLQISMWHAGYVKVKSELLRKCEIATMESFCGKKWKYIISIHNDTPYKEVYCDNILIHCSPLYGTLGIEEAPSNKKSEYMKTDLEYIKKNPNEIWLVDSVYSSCLDNESLDRKWSEFVDNDKPLED